jgi:hypothetical protein
MNEPGYEKLADVLQRAFDQAAKGKGKDRHAQGEPFHEQVMQIGARKFGVGSLLFQAFKKSEESQRLPLDRGVNELLGAIVYLAGAVIAREAQGEEVMEVTGTAGDPPPTVEKCCGMPDICNKPCVPRALLQAGDDGWITWNGGECPVPPKTKVRYRLRKGPEGTFNDFTGMAGLLMWQHDREDSDVIAYRLAA